MREIAALATLDAVNNDFLAVAEAVYRLTSFNAVTRLQGRHIWSEQVLAEWVQFGREPGLFALLLRVYRRSQPARLPLSPIYRRVQVLD